MESFKNLYAMINHTTRLFHIDKENRILVGDDVDRVIKVFDQSFKLIQKVGEGTIGRPGLVVVDRKKRFIVSTAVGDKYCSLSFFDQNGVAQINFSTCQKQ